jgi:hypothetical protein
MQTIIDLLKRNRELHRNKIRKLNRAIRILSKEDSPEIPVIQKQPKEKLNAKIKPIKQPKSRQGKPDNINWEEGIYHILTNSNFPRRSEGVCNELYKMKYFTAKQLKSVPQEQRFKRCKATLFKYANSSQHPAIHVNANDSFFIK